MNIARLNEILNGIDAAANQIEAQERSLADYTGHIRRFTGEIRTEINPPADANAPRTRDQISPQEWHEYEWHDVTTMGDIQRKYIRGLRR